jgi:tetratricopeptide (TPR) repeat protein
VIWRIFKRRKSTTAKVDEAVPEVECSATTAPKLSGFYFEATPAALKESSQAYAPIDSKPVSDYAAAVRKRTRRKRNVSTADRGVTPVMIPSLREQALLYRMAAELRATIEPETGLALWKAYLALEPEDADSWFVYGQCLSGLGAWGEAQAAFTEARRLRPGAHLPVAALGYIAGQMGDAPGELALFEEAVELSGDAVEMLEALHSAQLRSGLDTAAVGTHERIESLLSET